MRKLSYNEIPHGDITSIEAHNIPAHDIILAGFPCQAFSVAGYRKGFDDTRGTLFFDVARIAKYHKPKVILEEIRYNSFCKILNTKDFNYAQRK